jgi:hypothetical protein
MCVDVVEKQQGWRSRDEPGRRGDGSIEGRIARVLQQPIEGRVHIVAFKINWARET